MFLRRFLISAFIVSIFIPRLVLAEAATRSEVPELNPLCWKKEDCVAAREKIMSKEKAAAGWVQNVTGQCNKKDWGQCLAGGEITTQIALGGQNKFLHIGDYILTIYKYAVGAVSIVAVIVIIISGIQYLTSGGSSEMITGAKKRIVGAVVGLLIVYFSYAILHTIDPSLVSLRLPRVWMLKEQRLMPNFCRSLPASTMANKSFALGANYDDQAKELEKPTGKYDLPYKTHFGPPLSGISVKMREKFYCGKRFFVEDAGGATCMGDYCPPTDNVMNVCAPFGADQKQKYICKKGTVVGDIVYKSNLVGKDKWETNKIIDEDEQELWIICTNYEASEVPSDAETITESGKQTYVLISSDEDINKYIKKCGGEDKTAGFAVKLEMNRNWSIADANVFIGHGGKVLGFSADFGKARIDENAKFFADSFHMHSRIKYTDLIPVSGIKSGIVLPTINADTIPKL